LTVLLPNADRAFIDLRKLADYSLWPEHPVGGHKAILFQRVLDITAADALTLRDILLHVAPRAEAAIGRLDEFGQRYTIDFTLSATTGSASIRSGWIVLATEDFPRLTTCFVLRD
jgi:hypothetical protein